MPNTWLMEPKRLPSKVIRHRASLGRLAMKDGYLILIRNEAQQNI